MKVLRYAGSLLLVLLALALLPSRLSMLGKPGTWLLLALSATLVVLAWRLWPRASKPKTDSL
jgi:hypothetical protein